MDVRNIFVRLTKAECLLLIVMIVAFIGMTVYALSIEPGFSGSGQKVVHRTAARLPATAAPANCFHLKDQAGPSGTLYTRHFVPYCGETAAEIAHIRAALPTRCPKGEAMVYSMDIETGQGEDAICEVTSESLVAVLYRSSERYAISGVILLNKP